MVIQTSEIPTKRTLSQIALDVKYYILEVPR